MGFGEPKFDSGLEKKPSLEVKIQLHLMRHDMREESGEATQYEIEQGIDPDNRTPLTPKGMERASEQGRDDVDLARARVMGSARIRSQHTAGFHMIGGRAEITGTESVDELEKAIQDLGSNQAHFREDKRLNFNDDKTAPLGQYLDAAYHSKTYLKTIVEESDTFARNQGSEYQSTYTGKAAQVADLINVYFKAAPRLVNMIPAIQKAQAEKHGEDIEQSEAAFERFMGSHQGIPECFLLKVVEVVEGIDARNEFLAEIGNAGFGYSEGYDISLIQADEVTQAELVYVNPRNNKETRIVLTQDILEGIIQEAEDMGIIN
jgi:hypothetical protein